PLPEHVRLVIRFVYITGWRTLSEVLPLECRQVDFEAEEVRLNPGTTKNYEGEPFLSLWKLKSLLEEQRAKADILRAKHVLPTGCSLIRESASRATREAWQRLRGRRDYPGRIPHDFKRTAVRNLVRAGSPNRSCGGLDTRLAARSSATTSSARDLMKDAARSWLRSRAHFK